MKNSVLITATFVIAISCLVFLGWAVDASLLKGSIGQIPSISPIEAVFFILTAASITLLKTQISQNRQYKVGQVCGLLVALLSALLLIKFFIMTSETPTIDPIIFWFNNSNHDNVKMSPFVAVSIFLIGIAILLIDYINRNGRYVTQWLILAAFLIEIFAISICSYGVLLFDGSFNFVINLFYTGLPTLTERY
jgi:hypothetical protein